MFGSQNIHQNNLLINRLLFYDDSLRSILTERRAMSKNTLRGASVVQLGKGLTVDFGSHHNLRVMRSSPSSAPHGLEPG